MSEAQQNNDYDSLCKYFVEKGGLDITDARKNYRDESIFFPLSQKIATEEVKKIRKKIENFLVVIEITMEIVNKDEESYVKGFWITIDRSKQFNGLQERN